MLILSIWTKCDLQHWTGVDQGLTQRHWPLRWNHAFLFTKIDKKRWSRRMALPINGMKVKMVANNDNEGYETRVDSRFPQSWDQHFGRWDQRQLFPAKLRWKKQPNNLHQNQIARSTSQRQKGKYRRAGVVGADQEVQGLAGREVDVDRLKAWVEKWVGEPD